MGERKRHTMALAKTGDAAGLDIARETLNREAYHQNRWDAENNMPQPSLRQIARSYPKSSRPGTGQTKASSTQRSIPCGYLTREQKLCSLKEDLLATLEDIERQLLNSRGNTISSRTSTYRTARSAASTS